MDLIGETNNISPAQASTTNKKVLISGASIAGPPRLVEAMQHADDLYFDR